MAETGEKKIIFRVLLLIYIGWILYFTIFAERLGRVPGDARYNLFPFTEIFRYIRYREVLGLRAVLLNIAGNVCVFIPVGILLPLGLKRAQRAAGTLALGLLITFFIECTQLIFRVGSFDVDDILLNTLGTVLGFALYRGIRRRIDKKTPVRIRKIR